MTTDISEAYGVANAGKAEVTQIPVTGPVVVWNEREGMIYCREDD